MKEKESREISDIRHCRLHAFEYHIQTAILYFSLVIPNYLPRTKNCLNGIQAKLNY